MVAVYRVVRFVAMLAVEDEPDQRWLVGSVCACCELAAVLLESRSVLGAPPTWTPCSQSAAWTQLRTMQAILRPTVTPASCAPHTSTAKPMPGDSTASVSVEPS